MCQLKFTLSNFCAEPKDVNVFQVCFLTLGMPFFFCWKTLEHIEAYKTASVMSVQTILSADTIQRYLNFSWESRRSEVLEKPRQRKKNQGGLSRNLGETGAEGDKAANADGQW